MQTKIMFMKLTDQGRKAVKEAPARVEAGIKGWEKMGGKMLGFYVTFGGLFDYVAVVESPSDAAAHAFRAALESQGFVKTTYSDAYTPQQFAEIIKNVP